MEDTKKILLPEERALQRFMIEAFIKGFKSYICFKGLEVSLYTSYSDEPVSTLAANYNLEDFSAIENALWKNDITYVVFKEVKYEQGRDQDYESFFFVIPEHPLMVVENVSAYIQCWLQGLFMRDIAGIKNGKLGLVFYGFDAFNPEKLATLARFQANPENFAEVAETYLSNKLDKLSIVRRLT